MLPNPDPDSPVVEYQMGYLADEFGKVLQGPFTGERSEFASIALERHRWRITAEGDDLDVVVAVEQAPPRTMGLFKLPVLRVRFEFESAEAATRERFFQRFHQYFQKGGG